MSRSAPLRQRLEARAGEIIDRARPVSVHFDGEQLSGFAGDNAASLLATYGRRTFFGSVREPRPGGVRRVTVLDPEAWVWVDGEGLVPAGSYRLQPGDRLSSYQRRASTPSARSPMARWPIGGRSGIDRQSLPAAAVTPGWLAALRRPGARAATAPGGRMHADVVVVGGGVAGMAAARAAADAGADVIVVEADAWLGGSARWSGSAERRHRSLELAGIVADHPGIVVLRDAIAAEAGVDGSLTVVERGANRERVWVLSASSVVLACGLLQRSVPFAGSHLPGVMVPAGARRLVELWAVRPGQRALLACDERSAASTTALADELADIGVDIAGVTVLGSSAGHLEARGELALEEVVLPSGRVVEADLLITSFGTGVDTSLLQGLGVVVTRSPSHELVLARLPAQCAVVGAMAFGHVPLSASAGAGSSTDGAWREAHAAAAGRRLARSVLRAQQGTRRRAGARQTQGASGWASAAGARLSPPSAPMVVVGTEPTVIRPVNGLIDAPTDLRVEGLDGFAGSSPAATERLVVGAAHRAGLGPEARLVLADLAASSPGSRPVVDLVLQGGGPIHGPTLGGLAALHQPALRRSPLHDWHVDAGARFGPCEGWVEVLHYGDVLAEVRALQAGVGVRDLGGAACFEIIGPRAAELVGDVLGVACETDRLDDLHESGPYRRVRIAPQAWQLSAVAGTGLGLACELEIGCLDRQPWEVSVVARHEDLARFRLCGSATPVLLEAMGLDAVAGRRRRVRVGELEAWALLHSSSECDLQVRAELAQALWTYLFEAGGRLGLRAVGLDAGEAFERQAAVGSPPGAPPPATLVSDLDDDEIDLRDEGPHRGDQVPGAVGAVGTVRVGPLGPPGASEREVIERADGAWLVSSHGVATALRLSEADPCAKVLVLAPPAGPMAEVLGVTAGQAELFSDGLLVAGLAPGEWLALSPGDSEELETSLRELAGPQPLIVERSSGLAVLRLTGGSALTVLAGLDDRHLAGLELSDGAVVVVTLANVRCMVVRDDLLPEQLTRWPEEVHADAELVPSFLVLCDRSLAPSVRARLLDAGAFDGIEAEGYASYRAYQRDV